LADEVEFSKEGRRVQLTFQLTQTPADETPTADHIAA
jgi:serine/threonine-protein kinase RsbW